MPVCQFVTLLLIEDTMLINASIFAEILNSKTIPRRKYCLKVDILVKIFYDDFQNVTVTRFFKQSFNTFRLNSSLIAYKIFLQLNELSFREIFLHEQRLH